MKPILFATTYKGNKIYINANYVIGFQDCDTNTVNLHTIIKTVEGTTDYATETPEEIYKIINDCLHRSENDIHIS